MSKRTALIVALATALGILTLILGAILITPKGGTPIIIKGGGEEGESASVSVSGLKESETSLPDAGVYTIQVTADDKSWAYKIPGVSFPELSITTDPEGCNVNVEDQLFGTPVGFDRTVLKWDGTQGMFVGKGCKLKALTIDTGDWVPLVDTECTGPSGSSVCPPSIDLSTAKQVDIKVNY
jgi:hypothetical protein